MFSGHALKVLSEIANSQPKAKFTLHTLNSLGTHGPKTECWCYEEVKEKLGKLVSM